MSIEGRLMIDLSSGVDSATAVRIASSRPFHIVQTFIGRPPQEVVRTLPLLFGICGAAQGTAAAMACEKAMGLTAPQPTQILRALLVSVETTREHLIRIAMDWRRFLGETPVRNEIIKIMQFARAMRKAIDPANKVLVLGGATEPEPEQIAKGLPWLEELLQTLVFAEPASVWVMRQSFEDVAAWAQAGETLAQRLVYKVIERRWDGAGAVEARHLPELDDATFVERLFAPDGDVFVTRPEWDGAPCETTPLSRQHGHPLVSAVHARCGTGLLTRLVARLVELGRMAEALRAGVVALRGAVDRAAEAPPNVTSQGRGAAQVEAARGRLVHGVEIISGVVACYRILAPTEWNFHPQGAAARGLAQIAQHANGASRPLADLLINAVDPCVGYELRVS